MNGFVIKYNDIYELLWEYKEKLEGLIEKLEACETSIRFFIESETFQGESANAIKNYLNDVHLTMISSFKVTAQNLLDNIVLYKAGYYEIDDSTNFVLPEETIREFRTKLNTGYGDTEDCAEEVYQAVSGISDISAVSQPDTNGVFKIHAKLDQELMQLVSSIETQESNTVKALENSTDLLIGSLQACIGKIGTNWADINHYESNSFYTDTDAYTLAGISQIFYQQHQDNEEVYNEIWGVEQGLRDAAEARETQGVWKTVGGGALVVTGVLCIAATGGAATPIVAAGWGIGGGTIAFGVSDSIEGAQDIYYGSMGDIDSTAINQLKDVVFQGNEDAYYFAENIFAFAASAFIPISHASVAGNLTFRSGTTIVAKEGLSTLAGEGVSNITMKLTDNQTASMLAGMMASGVTAQGLNGIDAEFNISGNKRTNKSKFKYEHNPSDNPKVLQDAMENSNAVYGYSPNPNSESIGGYAEAIDWSNPEEVAQATARREMYHIKNDNISELVIKMEADGYSVEEIARAANQQRNLNRLNDYIDDPEGLVRVKNRNMNKYGNENGPTVEFLYSKYGSWEKVIEKTMSANPGMDACCGLYDKYFYLYNMN